jgi:hypothetical protein
MMNSCHLLYLIIFAAFFFGACEEVFIPDDSNYQSKIVVESYIEKSSEGLPVYLILTRTIGFFGNIDATVIENLFVKADSVLIIADNEEISLMDLCLSDLPPEARTEILKRFGFDPDSVNLNFCIYTDLSGKFQPKEGSSYDLKIIINDTVLSARTSIPKLIPLDSIWFEPVPGIMIDSFVQMICSIRDVAGENNFYRYFTGTSEGALIANFSSVTDDFLFDGQEFQFPLQKAEPPGTPFSDTLGYFRIGDTVRVKWCNLDKDHFEFWNTLEVSRTRQGPFSSYLRVKTNINGGLGIFGGQNCEYYTILVKR